VKRVLQWFVRVFPQPFRRKFEAELSEFVAEDYERARSAGRAAAFWFVLTTVFDLVWSGVAEHWRPSWVDANASAAERRGMRWRLEEWVRDLRHSVRGLRRAPGFTVMAVGTLGVAIGANAGMFSVVKTVLLDPLPYAHTDRLVHIAASAPGSDFPEEFGVAAEFYVQYKEQSRLLEDVSTHNSYTSTLRVGERVERVRMSSPTNSLFSTLGAKPILGRLPIPADESNAVVISYALWQSWFAGDTAVLGRTYDVSFSKRTIIGVMGPDFRFPTDETLLWLSTEVRPEGITPGNFGVALVGRMKRGATIEDVRNELTALARRLPERFGGEPAYVRLIGQHRAVVRSLEDQLLGSVSRPLWVLLSAAGIVLLIACANVANLFLVRGEGRYRDLAVRRAIGAARRELIRFQMSEAFVVAALAGVLAVGLAVLTLPAFLRAAPPDIPRLDLVRVSASTILFTLAAGALSALACGLIPAWRGSAPDLVRLREGGRGSTRKGHVVRDLLVAAQTALALVLLIGSGLLVRSFWGLMNVDPGYETEDLFTFQIAPDRPSLNDGPTYARFELDFIERLKALPGVQSVGLVENIPLNEGVATGRFRTEGSTPDGGSRAGFTFTAGDYFKTMGISVLKGRPFETSDHLLAPGNIIVSQSAAQLFWPGQDALGKRLYSPGDTAWFAVIGVVEDVMQESFRDSAQALVYFPLVGPTPRSWWVSSPAYVLKTPRSETIAPEVRALVREVAPEAPMYRVFTMAGLARDSMVSLSFTMLTLGITSLLALILGAVGLYGVLSYVVAQRTREIGVRMALGAKAEQVRLMVVAQGARVVGAGVVLGIVAALASTRTLGSLLFGVAPLHAPTFAFMSLSMVLVGLLASYLPARKASNVDPIESLRGD
jgi:putative ABC transport system permease protein